MKDSDPDSNSDNIVYDLLIRAYERESERSSRLIESGHKLLTLIVGILAFHPFLFDGILSYRVGGMPIYLDVLWASSLAAISIADILLVISIFYAFHVIRTTTVKELPRPNELCQQLLGCDKRTMLKSLAIALDEYSVSHETARTEKRRWYDKFVKLTLIAGILLALAVAMYAIVRLISTNL